MVLKNKIIASADQEYYENRKFHAREGANLSTLKPTGSYIAPSSSVVLSYGEWNFEIMESNWVGQNDTG